MKVKTNSQFDKEYSMYNDKNMEKESAVFPISTCIKWNKLLLKLRGVNYYWKQKNKIK